MPTHKVDMVVVMPAAGIPEVFLAAKDLAAEELADLRRPAVSGATVHLEEPTVEHPAVVTSQEVITEETTIRGGITEIITGIIIEAVHLVERLLDSTLKGQLLESPHPGGPTMQYRYLQLIMIRTINIPLLHLPT